MKKTDLIEVSCSRFRACPICLKCMNVDLTTVRCGKCHYTKGTNKCNHTHNDRRLIIRRNNFKLDISDDFIEWIKELESIYAP